MENEKAKAFMTELLNKRLRVRIRDGRVIDGNLMCTDKEKNIVISSCEEFLTEADLGESCSLNNTLFDTGQWVEPFRMSCVIYGRHEPLSLRNARRSLYTQECII